MMKKIFFSLLCFLTIHSFAQPVTIDMLAANRNQASLKLSDIASSIQYIKLETPDEALIGHTNMMDIRNEHLVVAYDAIYLFDTLGNFNKILARKGRGPGEYIEFGGMQFAPEEELLYLHNRAGNNMLRIDLNSGFLNQIKRMNGLAQDFSLTPRYILDFGKEKLPDRIKGGMRNPNYRDEINKYSLTYRIYETQRYLMLNSSFRGDGRYLLHTKSTNETVSMSWENIFENDIDGGVDFWPQGVTTDGKLYLIIQMTLLKKHFTGKENSNSRIAQIVKSSQEEDNPVIMIVTLK